MADKTESLRTVRDFEQYAIKEAFSENANLYVSSGADSRSTPRHNEESFARFFIRPRILRDVSGAKLDCRVLNENVSCPIGVSPTGLHFLAHRDGELASSAGCMREGCIYILSSCASCTPRQVSTHVQDVSSKNATDNKTHFWMQVYLFKDRQKTLSLVREAEAGRFSGIVVTVDSPITGQFRHLLTRSFYDETTPRLSNLSTEPCHLVSDSLTFEDLRWLVENSKLPVIAKGILSGEDARQASQCGVSAVFVSNHGGRMIERAVPTIEVLSEVVEAVSDCGGGVDVYLDGGVRSGGDVFVALALGAKAVFVGRPAIWGLASDGENGVRKVLQILKEELLETMKLADA